MNAPISRTRGVLVLARALLTIARLSVASVVRRIGGRP